MKKQLFTIFICAIAFISTNSYSAVRPSTLNEKAEIEKKVSENNIKIEETNQSILLLDTIEAVTLNHYAIEDIKKIMFNIIMEISKNKMELCITKEKFNSLLNNTIIDYDTTKSNCSEEIDKFFENIMKKD